MKSLISGHQIRGQPKRIFFWTLLCACLAGAGWLLSRPAFKGSDFSPRHVYRVDYYDASLLQRILHNDLKIPSFVRLYRVEPEILLGESGVVDLWLNGDARWYMDSSSTVAVGMDIVFENIPPECGAPCPR
ncbi:hypothetical protein [Paracidovorax valerianellae]|uniref:hypothetical protein n=1 Tax=Paracidovorax valerianellae TaxID=187868 RepID=UPI0023028C3B|nr:hypothetical protein [Paracidovorax valerianellae]MDA8443607.1 hypothetical protein [Paracidovorax valerianellae]